MLADLVVHEAFLVAITPIVLTALIGFISYIFKQIRKSDEALSSVTNVLASIVARIDNLEHRTTRIEDWQDGVTIKPPAKPRRKAAAP